MEQSYLELLNRIENLENRLKEIEQQVGVCKNLENKQNQSSMASIAKCSNRDKTKYIYSGKILPKNRLVLSVIRDYIKQNPSISLKELQKVFDKSLQGSKQVVEQLSVVKNIFDYGKRYFCAENEILTLNDDMQVVVCTQWGIFNIKKFILVARQLGFEINEI